MVGIIRKTGEKIEIVSYSGRVNRTSLDFVSYIDSKGGEHTEHGMNLYWDIKIINEDIKDINNNIPSKREQIILSILNGILANDSVMIVNMATVNKYIDRAIECADYLIEKLKDNKEG